MNSKMYQFPATNPNPVLSVGRDGTVFYSNVAGEPLLHEWGVQVGEKAPSYIGDFVQKVISRNRPEKTEVNVGKRVYLVTFHPLPEEDCVNLYGFDISDQKEYEEKLIESEEQYRTFFNNSAVGNVEIDLTGRIIKVNDRFCQITGYSRDELLRMNITELSHPNYRDHDSKLLADYLSGRTPTFDVEKLYVRKDGGVIWIQITAAMICDTEGRPLRSAGVIVETTERKHAEQERETTVAFLRLVNESKGTADLVHSAVSFFRERSGFEAVGIRLKDGDDYPYFEASGFPEEFVRLENSLCERDALGQIIRDSNGYPIHECMCGNVICGRFDPSKPFFTMRGSFCTNCTTELLATTTDADRQTHTRNRCNREGYESVALIALRVGEECFGLLQLNDKRKGQFSPRTIAMWERLADYLAVALAKTRAEEALNEAYEILQLQSEELQAQSEEIHVQNEELQAQSEELQVANEALAESEERFRTMANAISQLAWIARADGYIYWYNERWYAYTGTTPEQMEGWGWESVHDPAVLPKVLKRWKISIATGKPFDMEFPLRGSDGIFRTFLTRAFPLKDANGQVFQWFGTNTDITERKLAEEALRKQAALIDLSPDAIITRQLDGTITFWSKGAQLLYGWTSQEAIGQKTHTLLKTRFTQPLEQINKQIQQTGRWSGELIHCTKDDRQVIVQSRWKAEFDDQGHVRELLESNVDITDRKQVEESLKLSEQKFSMAFANNPAAIALTRLEDGLFLEVNDTWVALTGYSRDESIGNFARKMNIWPTAEAAANFVQVLRKKGFISGWEQEFYRKSGDVFTAQLSAQILTVREETMILSTLIDITERKRAEDKLTAAYSQIQNIIDNTPDLIYAFDLEECFVLANAAAANVLNSTPDRMIGKRRHEFMPKIDADWHEANDQQVFEVGRVLEFEEYSNFEDHSITWLTKKFPLRDAQGKIYAVAGISADITESRRAEEALRKSEEQYRMLFTNMTEGFGLLEVIYNCDGRPYDYRYLEINPVFERYLGVSREQLLGKNMRDTFPNVSPIAIEKYGEIALSSQPINFEIFSKVANKYLDIRAFIPEKGKIAMILRDVSERKQEEYRINRYNNILKGINRIFSSVVKAETEEELGNWFLSVAIGITGSQFGFVGEVGADGILHDIAISDMGWEQCLMYDKTGHRRPPGDFVLHGLYGHVVDSGKGFFTNNPSLHPDSIGLPQGHPPLTSFLGVPLISNGKTIGLIAVANREGGYCYEQQEDLEAITPAVVQTLEKKREEQERARAEEALIRRENEFRTLAENSPDVIARFDRQNRHLYANPAAAEVYGYSQEEIIGKTHSELGRDFEKTKLWEKHHQKVFATGHPEVMEFRSISPQGKEYYFNTQIVPEFMNGEVTSVLAISRNITDIKQAEAKLKHTLDNLDRLVKERTAELEEAYNSLKESERSLAEAQEMAHIGSWERNLTTNKLNWSDEAYRIFGLKPQEFEMNYSLFLNYVHPDDRDYIDNTVKRALNGKPIAINFRIISANGEKRIVNAKGEIVFDEKSNPVQIRGTIQDITEFRKSEEKIQNLANIVESSNDAIVTKSLDGIITSWNKGAEQLYGYSAEEVLGRPISILEPPMLPDETKKLTKMVKQGEENKQYDTLRIKKDGKIIHVSITLSPVFDVNGKLNAISVIARDITKRKEAEEALARIEIARKQEIHHRIKNNLQVISSLLDLQAEQFKDKECIKDSEVIEAFKESQDRVISMALIHEELYKGGGLETLNFSPYIKELAENLLQTYSLGNADISLNLDLAENIFFDMDIAVPLGMIVNELVTNSFKHAFKGRESGEIQIKLNREENGECINEDCESTNFALTVSDNGIGIPEDLEIEDLDTLGMQLVTTLVDQLDGKLELKRNNGMEFTIRFNVTENDNLASEAAQQQLVDEE